MYKLISMSISERLQIVMKMNGMTNSTFADRIGVQRSSISHVLAERNKPSIDFIQKILIAFPKVDANWLVTGKKVGKTLESSSMDRDEKDPYSPSDDKHQSKPFDEIRSVKPGQEQKIADTKSIQKVVVFYNDGTFEELANHA